MPRIVFTDPSQADLDAIATFIAEDNPVAAARFIQRIQARCAMLAERPAVGRPRYDLKPGLRCSPLDRYVIFYWAAEDGIVVARILHSARDIERQFRK
ncbi:type II toxin-antitoxin system RelE/ParE family toxin [Roseomonas genomospecies 6]|uniref:Type II toxin-antitoxin system RelE/ParE family toxin n=1 Tax=Roseomonas genomospecies 6 TaxID=214106 RepID=A0A9W7NJJ8_9PROT|nr:type II toxin-antitoxin system RelE/ParE family toxin [Roseomonas genomospecies 6]KAA0680417.1 type II toxin-antitoxin system RelE/ParE family toxin [Roseomonas genomospecies 6]